MKINFITTPNEEFNSTMETGLISLLADLTEVKESAKEYTIYAQEGGQIIGGITTYLYGKIIWVDSMYVEENRRQQGIGKILIDQVLAYAKNYGVLELQLNTYFPEAYQFFIKQGFENVSSVQNWKYGLTCYLMRRFV